MPRINAQAQMLGTALLLLFGNGALKVSMTLAASRFLFVLFPCIFCMVWLQDIIRDDCSHKNFIATIAFDMSIPARIRAAVNDQ